MNALTRGGGASDEGDLVTARIDLTGTQADEARDTLQDLSSGTDVTAAEALLELLLDAENRGMAPNPDWVEDAPSLVRATEGTEVAGDLTLAALRGQIALGRFASFRAALIDDTPGLTPETRRVLALLALPAATETASDAEFLKTEIGLSKILSVEDLGRSERFKVAERLVGLGLGGRAERYLLSDPQDAEERLLTAEVLSSVDDADGAIAVLNTGDDAETHALLGAILASEGKDEEAVDAFNTAGLTDEAVSAAMRAANWDWISESDEQDLAEATRSLLGSGVPDLAMDDSPQNGALILSSEALRAHAKTLLERAGGS